MATLALLLFLGTLVVFWPALNNGFVLYDDPVYVTSNPGVKAGLSAEGLRWALTTTRPHNWHPLTWVSHQVDWTLYGDDPRGHHLSSVWIHALTAALLFLALWVMTGRLGPSAAVSWLFALHPLRVESVAWIAERKDVLSGFFWVAVLLAWSSYSRRPRLARYLVVAGLFLAGLMSKPMVVTLPVVLLLFDFWPLDRMGSRFSWRRVGWLTLEKLPLLLLSAAVGLATLLGQSTIGAVSAPPWRLRLAAVATGYLAYLEKLLWPRGLAVIYPYPSGMPPGWQLAIAVAGLLSISAVAWWLRRRAPWLLVGWGWFVVTLLPVSGLVPVGSQWIADRYSYLPTIGLLIAIVWSLWDRARSRTLRISLLALLVFVLTVSAVATRRQIAVWRDSGTLFEWAISVTGPNPIAQLNLGHHLSTSGRLEEAVARYRLSLALQPGQARAHSNLGSVLRRLDRRAEAEVELRRALEIDPDLVGAHFNLAVILDDRGQPEESLRELLEVIALRPTYEPAWQGLATVVSRRLTRDGAQEIVLSAVASRPESRELEAILAVLQGTLGPDPSDDPVVLRGLQGLEEGLGVASASG